MTPGYYWANHKQDGWIIVEIVAGLHNAVLHRGNSVQRSEFGEIVGPLTPPEVKREAPAIPQP